MSKIFLVNTCESIMQRGSPTEQMGEYTYSEVDAGEIPADNLPKASPERAPNTYLLPCPFLAPVMIKGPFCSLQSSDFSSGKYSSLETKVGAGPYLFPCFSQSPASIFYPYLFPLHILFPIWLSTSHPLLLNDWRSLPSVTGRIC